MLRDLHWLVILALALPALPALADDDEEEGITAGLIDKDRRLGEIDRFYYDVLRADEDEDDKYDNDKIDAAAAWRVQDKTVELDTLTLVFENGVFYPRVAIDGDVFGAVFIGSGRWVFTPELALEQDTLERHLKERSLDKQFDELFLQFSPSYLEVFQDGGTPLADGEAQETAAQKLWEQRRKDQPQDFDWEVAMWHIQGMDDFDELHVDAKLAKVKVVTDTDTKGGGVFWYTWDPTDIQEVTLRRYRANPFNQYDTKTDLICHFPRKADRDSLTRRQLAYKDPARIDIEHYDAEFEIYQDNHTLEWGLRGDVQVTFKPILHDLQVLPLSLISWWTTASAYTRPLKVRGVSDADGNLLPYVHKYHQLAVELAEPIPVGETRTIRVTYEGEIIDTIKQPDLDMGISDQADAEAARQELQIVNYSLLNTYPWYPQNADNFWDRFTFDWQVTLPKPMLLASSGTLVGQEEVGRNYVFTVRERVPSALASIIFGRFMVVGDDPAEGRRPVIRVYTHQGLADAGREILDQAHDIIEYYEELFDAPYIYPEMDIAQMPYGVGFAQAPPGLVQMDGVAYLSKTLLSTVYNVNDPFLREAFLPHEIAHQWWAHKISTRTDHDYWMMEMAAEYSAALWEEAANGEAGYDRYVKYWLNKRGAKNTKNTIALWQAYEGKEPNRRKMISTAYGRGPLLMHELRQSLGYQKLVSVLRAMLQEYDGKNMATEDFQMILEAATGQSFDAYFEAFVYRNEPLGTAPEDMQ